MNRKTSFAIAGIFAFISTLSFFVVEVESNFIMAYVFILLGIGGLLYATIYAENHNKSYPWVLSIPMLSFKYLMVEAIISLAIVFPEQTVGFSLPTIWFFIIHVAVLAYFVIRIMMLQRGVDYVQKFDEKAEDDRYFMQTLKVETELLVNKVSERESKLALKKLADTARYTHPTSKASVAGIEQSILLKMSELNTVVQEQNSEQIISFSNEIIELLSERNLRCKAMK
ncbi:MAG: hypothetical protein R3Y54_00995 [Eubacteriales bacterium]